MKIMSILENSISEEIFNENEKEFHIPVILDEQTEKECCFICAVIQDNEDPTFILLSDMRSEDIEYNFTDEEINIFNNLIKNYNNRL